MAPEEIESHPNLELAAESPDKDHSGDKDSKRPAGSILKGHLLGYFENTSIHGFSYLPHPATVNWCERLFWILVILTGFTLASLIINTAFREWADNPTITTTVTYSLPVTEVQVCDFLSLLSLGGMGNKINPLPSWLEQPPPCFPYSN